MECFLRGEQREAIRLLMDAGEYEHTGIIANEAITEAVARYLHDASLEKAEQQEGDKLTW